MREKLSIPMTTTMILVTMAVYCNILIFAVCANRKTQIVTVTHIFCRSKLNTQWLVWLVYNV